MINFKSFTIIGHYETKSIDLEKIQKHAADVLANIGNPWNSKAEDALKLNLENINAHVKEQVDALKKTKISIPSFFELNNSTENASKNIEIIQKFAEDVLANIGNPWNSKAEDALKLNLENINAHVKEQVEAINTRKVSFPSFIELNNRAENISKSIENIQSRVANTFDNIASAFNVINGTQIGLPKFEEKKVAIKEQIQEIDKKVSSAFESFRNLFLRMQQKNY